MAAASSRTPATGDPDVKALVYVDTLAPDQGQTMEQLINAVPGSCVGTANLIVVPYPGAPAWAVCWPSRWVRSSIKAAMPVR
jgi:hypothetical protein